MALLVGGIVVLHFIPIRFLLLFWGIMKFSRRILRPNTIPNNELLDFLSRVPDDEQIVSILSLVAYGLFFWYFAFALHYIDFQNQFRELPPTAPTDQSRNNPKKRFKAS